MMYVCAVVMIAATLTYMQVYYPMLVLGIIGAGGVFSGTNPSYTQYELNHHLKTSQSKFVITEPEISQNIIGAALDCQIPQSSIWIFDVHQQHVASGFKSWLELLRHGEKDWVRFDDEETSKNTTAARLFSSGTTGLPKAANLSHYNLVSQHTLVDEIDQRPYTVSHIDSF
jgi:long-subunit acyl-CoA synthetase (AMP-forming)